MSFIAILLLIFFIGSALILIGLVLIQNEDSEGLGGIFGGGASNQVGNRSGNILTRVTSILAAIFLLCAFGLSWLNRAPSADNVEAAARRLEAEAEVAPLEWWLTEEEAEPESLEDGGGVFRTQ